MYTFLVHPSFVVSVECGSACTCELILDAAIISDIIIEYKTKYNKQTTTKQQQNKQTETLSINIIVYGDSVSW